MLSKIASRRRFFEVVSPDPAHDTAGEKRSEFSALLSEVARTPSIPVKRTLQAGDRVGDYVVLEAIGQGAFGIVYRVVHPVLRSEAAVKVLNSVYTADEGVSQRFVEEARTLHRTRHPNIVELFGFGQLPEGQMYYSMELLNGETLRAHLAASGAFEPALALDVLQQVADALDTAHAHGVLHRDLKPDNIFVVDQLRLGCRVKLLDFGVAKVLGSESELRTRTGVLVGTPGYMSPEQCGGQAVDAKSDIYALGVLAFELLTGKPLFEFDNVREAMAQHMFEDPPRASATHGALPANVDDPLRAMLHKRPAKRPASASEAVAALSEALLTAPLSGKRRQAVGARSYIRWTLGAVAVSAVLWGAQWLYGGTMSAEPTDGRLHSAATPAPATLAATAAAVAAGAAAVDPKTKPSGAASPANAPRASAEAGWSLESGAARKEPGRGDARRGRADARPSSPAWRRHSRKRRAYGELEF